MKLVWEKMRQSPPVHQPFRYGPGIYTKNNLPLNGISSDTVFNLFSDNYQLFLYDQNGCMFTDSITLSEPDVLEFDSFIFKG